MNLERIHYLIKHPQETTASDINPLKELTVKYPYAQLFPILYLKALHQNKDIRFEEELQRLAYTISDRAMLYGLVHEEESVNEIDTPQIALKEKTLEATEMKENVIEVEIEQATEINESIIEEIESTLHPAKSAVETCSDESDEKEETIEVEIPQETIENDRFIDEITAQTIASSYSLEHEEKRIAELLKKEPIADEIESENEPTIETSSFKNSIAVDTKMSFSSWLKSNENHLEQEDEKVLVDDLVAKFIENSPKISKPDEKLFEGRKETKEFFSPIKKAKESLDDKQLPVSETLAKIFAAQGNFPKAIYAYEQLMLIIPEKKIFFANQIKELQKKLNN